MVVFSVENPVLSSVEVNMSAPSSPVVSDFLAEFNSSAPVAQVNSIDPDPVYQAPIHPN